MALASVKVPVGSDSPATVVSAGRSAATARPIPFGSTPVDSIMSHRPPLAVGLAAVTIAAVVGLWAIVAGVGERADPPTSTAPRTVAGDLETAVFAVG